MNKLASQVISGFKKNYKEGFDPYKLSLKDTYEYSTIKVLVKNGNVVFKEGPDVFNLASTAKPLILRLLVEVSLTKNKELRFRLTKEAAKELIDRGFFLRILTQPIYQPVLEWLRNNLKPEYISLKDEEFIKKLLGQKTGIINWKSNDELKCKIDLEELSFQMLTISSNFATEIAIARLRELCGTYEEMQIFLEKSRIAPTYTLYDNAKQFWPQAAPNCGNLEETALAFDKLTTEIVRKSKKQKPFLDLQKALKNNHSYHPITGVSWELIHKGLINNDCFILEKTGAMWPIAWGNKLSEAGYPPHLTLGTQFTIFKKENGKLNKYTVCFFKVIAVAIPRNLDENHFLDLTEKNYSRYISLVSSKYIKQYRKELFKLLSENIFENKNLKPRTKTKSQLEVMVKRILFAKEQML